MNEARRETLLRAAFALWGLAFAISLYSVFDRAAPPGQLPGFSTQMNRDAHGPFHFVAGLMILPLFFSLALRPIARRLAAPDARAWARNAALIAPPIALWFVSIQRAPLWTLVPCAIAIAMAFALRRVDLRFTRSDAVLLPVLLATLLAVHDCLLPGAIDRAVLVSLLIVFAVRIAATTPFSPRGGEKVPKADEGSFPPALLFLAAPLALLLQTGFFARDQRYFGWHALTFIIVSPFVLRLFLRNARLARRVLVLAIYPIALYAYVNATSLVTAEGKPRVSVFEESHSLLPASEYLRGERPYRDILPAHGLLEDGYFDYLAMLARGRNIGTTWKTRLLIGTLSIATLYALGAVLTGSAEAGLFGAFLALLTGVFTPSLRFFPALITLALILAAVRWRRVRWLRWAGLGTVICGLTSLDLAAYTFVTLLVAVLRLRGRAFREAAIGIAIGVVPLFTTLLFFGIFDDFLRGTFLEVLSLGPVYTLTIFALPPALQNIRTFPEVLAGLFHRDSYLYLFWPAVTVFVAASIGRRVSRCIEPFFLLGVWIFLAAISYAERQHLYYKILAPVFVAGVVFLLVRRRHALAIPAVLTLIVLAAPSTHIGVVSWMRQARGPTEAHWVEIADLPRARGALFHRDEAQTIDGIRKYLGLALGPEDTFFDFSNRGLYYFLFRRDCPIRQYEVAFYETEERQREVISRLENNPRVRAALLPGASGRYTVDGVQNAARAPLVWQYLQTHFEPDFQEGDVVFWRRKR